MCDFFAQKRGYGEEEFCVKRSRLTVLHAATY